MTLCCWRLSWLLSKTYASNCKIEMHSPSATPYNAPSSIWCSLRKVCWVIIKDVLSEKHWVDYTAFLFTDLQWTYGDLCWQYFPGSESKRVYNHASIDDNLFRVCVQIRDVFCPIFVERARLDDHHATISHSTLM